MLSAPTMRTVPQERAPQGPAELRRELIPEQPQPGTCVPLGSACYPRCTGVSTQWGAAGAAAAHSTGLGVSLCPQAHVQAHGSV